MADLAKTGNSRVFLIDGRARGDHKPSYESTMRMGSPSQGFGDIERIENPDPDRYGEFIEVDEVRGATERATTSLEGRYARELASDLLEIARRKCAVDIQLHFGECQDPNDFNTFDKALVFENASITTWSAEDLGALTSGDNTVINESVDISAKDMYEILAMGYGEKASSIVTNEVVDVTLCDVVSCGECEDVSDGCYKVYAVTKAAGGSPSTPADVVFSIDKGTNWYAHDVDSLGAAEEPTGIACIGSYIVVISNDSVSQHYALKSEFDGVQDPTFTEVATGYVGAPNAIHSLGSMAFVVGDSGYIYKCDDGTAGVTVLDAGSATANNLNDVHAISSEIAVAVGELGTVVYTTNQTTWTTATAPEAATLNAVLVKSSLEWWVGTATGNLYYTLDSGTTWTLKAFSGSGSGVVHDIAISTDSVMWLAHATTTPAGRILRSYDGGYSWQIAPEGASTLPANDRVNALVGCKYDPNFVVGVGLADDGSDGYIVVGSD